MSVDAIAVLPAVPGLTGTALGEGWMKGAGPGGLHAIWFPLRGGTLVNLGSPYLSPDAQLYDLARRWSAAALPARVWVFPDTYVPEVATASEMLAATASGGRWVEAGQSSAMRSPLERLGFDAAEIDEWQDKVNSGDPTLIGEALAAMGRRLEGRSSEELEAALAELMKPSQAG